MLTKKEGLVVAILMFVCGFLWAVIMGVVI